MGYYNIENRGRVYEWCLHNKDANIPLGIAAERAASASSEEKIVMIYHRREE